MKEIHEEIGINESQFDKVFGFFIKSMKDIQINPRAIENFNQLIKGLKSDVVNSLRPRPGVIIPGCTRVIKRLIDNFLGKLITEKSNGKILLDISEE